MPSPVPDKDLGLAKGLEHLAVKQLVPECRIEALAVAILSGTVRLDEQRLHADPAKPAPDRLGGELGAIVRPDVLRWPVLDEQVSQSLQHIVRHQCRFIIAERTPALRHPRLADNRTSTAFRDRGRERTCATHARLREELSIFPQVLPSDSKLLSKPKLAGTLTLNLDHHSGSRPVAYGW